MRKTVAKSLAMVIALSAVIVSSPVKPFGTVDVVSAATNETSTTTTSTKTPVKTTPTKTTSTKAATPTVPGQTYTVAKGDKMWKIAAKFGLTLDQLKGLNPQIKNANLIRVGQKITVAKAAATTTPVATAKKFFHGFGEVPNYRFKSNGMLNITTASVVFDQDGKIVDLKWDVLEITDKLFPGWADPKSDAAAQAAFKANIDNKWESKWEEGDNYGMKTAAVSGKEWYEQMGFYQNYFKGMTVAEVEDWFNKYTDVNHRPYKFAYPDKMTDADKAATANFTAAQKQMLVDVTTSATMSLEDDHSHFMTALKEAYAARTEVK